MLPELHTNRLILREAELEDGPALQEMQNRPEQLAQQAVDAEEVADGTARLQRYMEHRGPDDARRLYVYVAHEKIRGALVGAGALSRPHPKIGTLGFGIATEYWRRGYATEMAARLIAFGFEEIGLHRITADIAAENMASRRVAEKIGMKYEGTARDCIFAQGRWWTEAKYAILARDRMGTATPLPSTDWAAAAPTLT